MSDKSGIAWTDATWNPSTGCTKVSQGCKNCYAKHQAWPRLAAMKTGVYAGREFEDVQFHVERLDQPLRWTKPRMIFVNSMSDLFHEDLPDEFIDKVFAIMAQSGKHTFQVLTKRPRRMRDYMRRAESLHLAGLGPTGQWPPHNVWLGVSVEDQETADERIPLLLETPAAVRWLSCEPLLDEVNLECFLGDLPEDEDGAPYPGPLHWVVVGGESGPKARKMHISWALDIRTYCRNTNTPFFMKQGSQANWGKGWKDMADWVLPLQVQEYPEVLK